MSARPTDKPRDDSDRRTSDAKASARVPRRRGLLAHARRLLGKDDGPKRPQDPNIYPLY